MKLAILALTAALAAAPILSGCTEGYAYGPSGPYADVDYDGFYDDYYGPFNGGYWGPGDAFYYSDQGGHFHRDVGHHFRRQASQGFHSIHGHAPAASGRGSPH
jgi:hypothetical protein